MEFKIESKGNEAYIEVIEKRTSRRNYWKHSRNAGMENAHARRRNSLN